MKKLIALTVATSVFTLGTFTALADDMSDYSTRTLRARHAQTTGSPDYADEEREEYNSDKHNADFDERMEDHSSELDDTSGFEGQENEESRTDKARDALDTGDDY